MGSLAYLVPFLLTKVIIQDIPVSFVRIYYFVGIFLLLGGYFVIIARFVKKLQVVETRLSFKEKYIKIANRVPPILLWSYLLLNLAYVFIIWIKF